ncbi:hypothetical protein [Polynucleobacter sp. MWH-UH2A]|uniref:hypothetical protein n=1 Tax=Polynucleobacter sp. MWH-UH2A TaxID=1855617 RepID=UPI001BFD6E09|nr:hypothetical protein [Polynucleobacter sp. MWH-UH2A]QWD64913.1 hypothetical protein IC571_04635 [Polynucleobacter sp. MWH-UH2A]
MVDKLFNGFLIIRKRLALKFFAFVFLLNLSFDGVASGVVAVPPLQSGVLYSSQPIMTMYYSGVKAKRVIVYLSGGWGRIGLKASTGAMVDPFSKMLIALTKPKLSSGKFDVVFMDSPSELHWMTQRGSADHLSRIQSVVQYYKNRTGLPVWLMGHSNGALSLSAFVHYLQEANEVNMVDGLIISAARNETSFSPPLTMPMLFLHHEEDGCINTQPKNAYATYERLIQFDKAKIKYVSIGTGEYDVDDPCVSGYHMYFGADREVISALDRYFDESPNR